MKARSGSGVFFGFESRKKTKENQKKTEEEEEELVVLVVVAAAAAAVVAMVLAPAFVFQGIGHFFPGFQGM